MTHPHSQPDIDAQFGAIDALADTEDADISFLLGQLGLGVGSAAERYIVSSFRRQIIQCAADISRSGVHNSDVVTTPKTATADEIEHLRRDLSHARAMQAVWKNRARKAEAQLERAQSPVGWGSSPLPSTDRQPPNSICEFCARRVFEPCQSIAQAQNACTLSSQERQT